MLAAATSRAGIAATVASALHWVARGQSYPALLREIVWTAARSVGASKDDLEWLSPLIEARLADRLDDLPRVARDAALQAEAEHLRRRPHDHEGADLLAELAAHDAAVEQLSIAYMDLLDWGVGLLRERRTGKRSEEPALCDVPQRVLDGLTVRSERPGWVHRRAA